MGDCKTSTRRRLLLAGIAVAAVLFLWLLVGMRGEPLAKDSPVRPQPAPSPVVTAPARAEPVREPGPTGEPAPVIDEVRVEKPEVCEGEENLVSVRAHTVNGSDAFLHTTIGSEVGASVPLRTWLDPGGRIPPRKITVFGRGGASASVAVPVFTVKKCRPDRMVFITARLRPNTTSEMQLEAVVAETPESRQQRPFVLDRYVWSFGDGGSAETREPVAVHSYEDRTEQTLYSQFVVKVEAVGQGETLVGRLPIQLMNPTFEAKALKGTVMLMAELTPRFPVLSSDGQVHQRVRLWHRESEPVEIERVWVVHNGGEGASEAIREAVSPRSALGADRVPPGRGVELEVSLDARGQPELFSIDYALEGRTGDGLPVRGAFSVMRPPSLPTKEASTPVMDPILKAKILAARRILNQPYVTDEEIWRLEREGKLAGAIAEARAKVAPTAAAVSPEGDPGPPPPGPMVPGGAESSRRSDRARPEPGR